jgi:2-polyprenyl-3-methyl-5-hydroxy-6-metoxy-1,4-benzoquinol methylase
LAAFKGEMNKTHFEQNPRKLRVLVAIASYGEKNLEFLKQIIQTYRGMAMEVEVVVPSEAPKDLGAEVNVVVGLPSKNPWSLPFAHKTIFAQNADKYDLFIYSEDDIGVTELNIQAFLEASSKLEPDEIPGYLRYEVCPDGTKLLTDVHGSFHWDAHSVRQRGKYTIAGFTNEHAGFYILTQSQLKRAIASGGFLKQPCEGRYGLPETAATDPYTSCGFRKVICISALEDFLIRHMSNLYVNRHGVSLSSFKEQVQTLINIRDGTHPASTLCKAESKFLHCNWSKNHYENPSEEVLSLATDDAKTILSIGCGWGATENRLKQRGAQVTALPLDSVIGAAAARLGIEVIYGTLEECLTNLQGRRFDCVLISNLLHLQSDPGFVLEQCSQFVAIGGTLMIVGPNFKRLPVLIKRALGRGDYRKLRSFDQSGISACGPGSLAKYIRRAGLRRDIVRWWHEPGVRTGWAAYKKHLGWLTAENWIIRARRESLSNS